MVYGHDHNHQAAQEVYVGQTVGAGVFTDGLWHVLVSRYYYFSSIPIGRVYVSPLPSCPVPTWWCRQRSTSAELRLVKRVTLDRQSPAVPAGAGIQLVFRHGKQVLSALTQQRSQVGDAGIVTAKGLPAASAAPVSAD